MGFRINPRGVDKNKRNTEAKQSQNKTNTGSVEDKIKQYINKICLFSIVSLHNLSLGDTISVQI